LLLSAPRLGKMAAAQPKSGLQHFAYECPGLHGRDSRMTIKPMAFRTLLNDPRQIVIPLFQRTYCWSDDQIKGWWNDIMSPKTSLGFHLTGKAIFKERDGFLVCLDGQQRSTTTSILLSSLRDAALELVESDASFMTLVHELNALLFKDPNRVYEWAEGQVHGHEEEIDDGSAQAFGMPILMPSFEDRIPFFRVITGGIVRYAYLQAGKVSNMQEKEASISTSVQSRAKGIFDNQLRSTLKRHQGAAAKGELLAGLVRTALDVMSITFCEILNDIEFPQVFLWLQEKSLFSMGSLLHNPAPGVPFRAADLLRNLVLAPSMRLSLQEQELLYRKHWLEPFERANGGAAKLDPILDAFLAKKVDPHRSKRHVSSLEHFAVSFLSSPAGTMVSQKTDLSGVLRYARLLSFAEACELRREGRELPQEGPVALSQETCDQLVAMLIDFASKLEKEIPPVPAFDGADLQKQQWEKRLRQV